MAALLALTLILAASLLYGAEAQIPVDPVAIPAYLYNASGASAFAYNPTILSGNAATKATTTFAGAGLSQARTAAQLPAIQGSGLSQTYFEVCFRFGCSAVAHTHLNERVHKLAATSPATPRLNVGYKLWTRPLRTKLKTYDQTYQACCSLVRCWSNTLLRLQACSAHTRLPMLFLQHDLRVPEALLGVVLCYAVITLARYSPILHPVTS